MKPALQSLSVLLIVTAVLEVLLPPGKTKRAFYVLCAVVLFACVLQPLRHFDFSALELESLFTPEESAAVQMQRQNETALLLAVKTGAETAAKNALENAGLPFARVTAHCETQGEEIVLSKLTVTGVPAEASLQAQRVLRALFKTETVLDIRTEEAP